MYFSVKSKIFPLVLISLLSGCATDNGCENIEAVIAQERMCKELHKRIMSENTSSLQVRGALQEQYQKECIDFRYYRDSFEGGNICTLKDKEQIEAQEKSKQQ
jgi:hypothetical protein